MIENTHDIVREFEEQIAEFTDAGYAVATDTCCAALFLCLKYFQRYAGCLPGPPVLIPRQTFSGVANAVIHADYKLGFTPEGWKHWYQLKPLPIVDAACMLDCGMMLREDFRGKAVCLSFQYRKPIPIGRGGMILTNSGLMADWCRKARWHGRCEETGEVIFPGWPFKMEPERAARGLDLLDTLGVTNRVDYQYPLLTEQPAYEDYPLCEDDD